MSNREEIVMTDRVHILMGLSRTKDGERPRCVRIVDKGMGDEIDMLEAKLRTMGGHWRIHRTVNARDIEKARKLLVCKLITHPEKASYIDSLWRTALLQTQCIYGQKKFMLDVDSTDIDAVTGVVDTIEESGGSVLRKIKTPNGWHFITMPFDTRKVCECEFVTLLRDGYYFVKEVVSYEDAPC